MEQFDQLLTCCICLDRYKNPKLLPCQHSYCMDPCMEGLVDYVKRQVKCPECRAEHRIPYNGIQGFPSNITLQKFLELHTEITGELPDPNADAIMQRCAVCSEKAYVNPCAHCDKKCCDDCKEAHCDILKREISRINNQIKRGIHRLEDCIEQVERNQKSLESNANTVIKDIEEVHRRLSSALKERTDYLKASVETYLVSEMRGLKELKANLELEFMNMTANSDLMEKHLNDEATKWDDNELMDCKDIFIKMMDFIRNYDIGSEEYTRRIRFASHDCINDIAKKILEIGDLKFHESLGKQSNGYGRGNAEEEYDPPMRGLARSKSDHRLVAEFRRREEENRSPPMRRRFGESRYSREENKSRTNFGRYNDDDDIDTVGAGRFRSRFLRPDDDDDVGSNRKSLHMDEEESHAAGKKSFRTKVVETEDASRGTLSGIIRLADSSRIIHRLKEMEMELVRREKKKNEPPPPPPPVKPFVSKYPAPSQPTQTEDEIDRIKRENKVKEAAETSTSAASTTATTTSTASTTVDISSTSRRPSIAATETPTRRLSATTNNSSIVGRYTSNGYAPQSVADSADSSSSEEEESSYEEEEEEEEEQPAPAEPPAPVETQAAAEEEEDDDEYEYYDYDEDEEEEEEEETPASSSTTTTTTTSAVSTTLSQNGATTTTTYSKPSYSSYHNSSTPSSSSLVSRYTSLAPEPQKQPETPPSRPIRAYGGAATTSTLLTSSSVDNEDEDLLSNSFSRRRTRDDSDSFVSRYLAKSRSASVAAENGNDTKNSVNHNNITNGEENATRKISGDSQYPSGRSRYAALRDRKAKLARSKSSAVLGRRLDEDDANEDDDDNEEVDTSILTPFTSRFGGELARSKSSHHLKNDSNDSGGNKEDANLSSWAKYLKNKYGGRKRSEEPSKTTPTNHNNLGLTEVGPRGQYLQKQKALMTFGTRGSQNGYFTWPRGIAVGPDNSIVVADSSNHRVQIFTDSGAHKFSFGRYGNGEGEFDCLAGVAVNRIGQYIIADRYNHRIQIFDPSGHFLRTFGSQGSAEGRFSYPWGVTTDALGFIYVCDKENHRIQVFQSDGTYVGKFGLMGSKPGQLEHPHYIAVSNTNRVIVSDSNNHRIQIFDVTGKVLTTFGSEGTGEAQFKFPRGVAVDEQGYIFVADSGNNRIQIFNPDGTFLRCFGRWGQSEGEFKGLEGIAVNSNGNILVADRENHRVQMF